MTLVKVCGICDLEAARAAAEAGADLIGFHFCSSPRRVTPAQAGAMARELAGLNWRPRLVGVFIDQPPAEVAAIAEAVGLDYVQLHGQEAPGYEAPRPVIKALKVRAGVLPDPGAWPDPILIDSWSQDGRGGTGRSWDWELARPLLASRRVIIAGGLTPLNVRDLVVRYRPHGVDVSSGVESSPRVKDPGLIHAFVEAARVGD